MVSNYDITQLNDWVIDLLLSYVAMVSLYDVGLLNKTIIGYIDHVARID